MKQIFTILFILILTPGVSMAEDLKTLSLDDVSSIGTTIETDSNVKMEGRGAIKITTIHPTTVCLGEVADLDIDNATLVYKARVKTELEGSAFLEMWAHLGGGQYFSKGMNDPVTGQSDWRTIQTPFIFQKGQTPDKLTLNIVINGKGIVWVDDVRLSKLPLK